MSTINMLYKIKRKIRDLHIGKPRDTTLLKLIQVKS